MNQTFKNFLVVVAFFGISVQAFAEPEYSKPDADGQCSYLYQPRGSMTDRQGHSVVCELIKFKKGAEYYVTAPLEDCKPDYVLSRNVTSQRVLCVSKETKDLMEKGPIEDSVSNKGPCYDSRGVSTGERLRDGSCLGGRK